MGEQAPSVSVGLGNPHVQSPVLYAECEVAGFAQNVAVHLSQGGLLQTDFCLGPLQLDDGGVGRQGALAGLSGDGLMHDVSEEVGPADQASGGVDDLEVQDAVLVGGVGHQGESRDLPTVAGHEGAEGHRGVGLCDLVGPGDGDVGCVFGCEQMFGAADEVGQPADRLLQIGIGVVNHQGIEADAGDDQEGMTTALFLIILVQQSHAAHVDLGGSVRGGHGQGGVQIANGNAHVPCEEIPGSYRDDAHDMVAGCHGAGYGAYGTVPAHGNDYVGSTLQCHAGAGLSVPIQLGFDETEFADALVPAVLLDALAGSGGLGLGGVDDESVAELVVIPGQDLHGEPMPSLGADDQHHCCDDNGRHRQDAEDDDRWNWHDSIVRAVSTRIPLGVSDVNEPSTAITLTVSVD